MELNNGHIKKLNKIRAGIIELPSSYDDLADMLVGFFNLQDIEGDERESFNRCARLYLVAIGQLEVNKDGFVYISSVKSRLNKRKYFRELAAQQASRGQDLMRNLTIALHRNKFIERGEIEIMITAKGEDLLFNTDKKDIFIQTVEDI